MEYKQTTEYAFDLLRHFYEVHLIQIEKVGKENIVIYIPEEIYELLKAKAYEKYTKQLLENPIYPTTFMGIDIKSYNGSIILFALKELNNGYFTEQK